MAAYNNHNAFVEHINEGVHNFFIGRVMRDRAGNIAGVQ